MEVRGEAGDDEPAIRVVAEQVSHGFAHGRLGRREAGSLGVGGVREQETDAAVAPRDLAEEREVGLAPVDGIEVELEVACVEDGARRREVGGGE